MDGFSRRFLASYYEASLQKKFGSIVCEVKSNEVCSVLGDWKIYEETSGDDLYPKIKLGLYNDKRDYTELIDFLQESLKNGDALVNIEMLLEQTYKTKQLRNYIPVMANGPDEYIIVAKKPGIKKRFYRDMNLGYRPNSSNRATFVMVGVFGESCYVSRAKIASTYTLQGSFLTEEQVGSMLGSTTAKTPLILETPEVPKRLYARKVELPNREVVTRVCGQSLITGTVSPVDYIIYGTKPNGARDDTHRWVVPEIVFERTYDIIG